MPSHKLDYEILGASAQTVEIILDPGETVIAEAGVMNYMTEGIRFETRMGDGSSSGVLGKLWGAGKRLLTGESLFMTHFSNQGQGQQRVGFAAPYPGTVVPIDLGQVGGRLICQKDAFLCAAYGTEIGISFNKRIGAGFFGGDYIKIRSDALFNERDVRALEVHEGMVHVGTTLNGLNQPVCTFLAKGPPSSTVTQEGLAILMEVIAFASYPYRLRKLTNRTRAIHMAEEGADFLQVFEFYQEQGYGLEESYGNASRVFRGSTPDGLPFTKDLSYLKGFILIYNYIQLAVRKGKLEQIPLLFCGKTTLEDMRTLRQLVDEGLVAPPKYLPPQFRDLNALAAWMCFSNFLNHLSLDRIEADYANIL